MGIDRAADRVATYSVLPYLPICNPGGAPYEVDGTLNEQIHEMVESATDPEGTGYFDAERHEIADKCVYPLAEAFPAVFAALLGVSASEGVFNQLIDGHSYYLQDVWSNTAGCVPRIGPTPSFTATENGYAGEPLRLNAAGSYDLSGRIATYAWNYGDGSPVDTGSGAYSEHIYAQPGTYRVSLTVTDSSGSADASTQTQAIAIDLRPPTEPALPSPEPNPGGGAGNPGSGPPGGGVSQTGSQGPTPATTSPTGKPAVLSRAGRLTRALKACHKLKKRERSRCVASAMKRFAPKRKRAHRH